MRIWVIRRATKRFTRDIRAEATRSSCAFGGALFGATSGIVLTVLAFAAVVSPLLKRQYAADARSIIDRHCRSNCAPAEQAAYLRGVIDSYEQKAQVFERWVNKEYSIVKPGGVVEQVNEHGRPVGEESPARRESVGPPTPVARESFSNQ